MRASIRACSLLIIASAAQAGSPLFTEDASVLDQEACELESYLARSRPTGDHSGGVQVGCGLPLRSQVTVAVGRDSGSASDLATVVGKTSLVALSERDAGLAIVYAASFQKQPTAATRYESTEAKLALTIPAGHWLLHANTGWARARSEAVNVMTWNLAAERSRALPGLDLMAEIFGDNHHDPWLRVAARWTLAADRVFLYASWGRQANPDKNQLLVTGLHLAF